MKHLVPTINASVRRDAMTTIPVLIPAHELEILYSIHGKDNVYEGEPGEHELAIDARGEFDRLALKYGDVMVREAYGAAADGDIRRLVEANSTGTVEEEQAGIQLEGPDSKPVTTPKAATKPKAAAKAAA